MAGLPEPDDYNILKKRIEVAAVILIALATIASAWSVYQSARWSGHQTFELSRVNALRAESTRATTIANTKALYEMDLFLVWLDATRLNQTLKAEFLKSKFSDDFLLAFNTWIEMSRLDNISPPGTPFDLPEYQAREKQEINRTLTDAENAVQTAKDYNQISDNYVLSTVLYSLVLFCSGMSTRWESLKVQKGMVTFAGIIFFIALAFVLTLPISFSV
jgi:hypothetical protein